MMNDEKHEQRQRNNLKSNQETSKQQKAEDAIVSASSNRHPEFHTSH
jgi:hypothetical protein